MTKPAGAIVRLPRLFSPPEGRRPVPPMDLPTDLDPAATALFLDCDGTLAAIAERPSEARIAPATLALLARLAGALDGALAVVSGRAVADLDRLLAPLVLPIAGGHGAERRDGAGRRHPARPDGPSLAGATARLQAFAERHQGLIVETKPASVALHYRMRPELAAAARTEAAGIAAGRPTLRLLHGLMVVEVSASKRTKGDAIAEFMAEPPFAGRRPVFVGDDVTDEDGFAAVMAIGGIAVKIGAGPSLARLRAADMAEAQAWLGRLAERWAA